VVALLGRQIDRGGQLQEQKEQGPYSELGLPQAAQKQSSRFLFDETFRHRSLTTVTEGEILQAVIPQFSTGNFSAISENSESQPRLRHEHQQRLSVEEPAIV
jgi:hypothetical protein